MVASGAEEIAGTPRTRLPHKSFPEKAQHALIRKRYNQENVITKRTKKKRVNVALVVVLTTLF
ncbi:MAG: hypothetical protein CL602_01395 [Alteromonas sp.]|nr:hypothetical protein [Alteromonas sp.]